MSGPDPAVAAVRVAVRRALTETRPECVLVACSGGADSVALAAATAFEARRLGVRAGLVTVDHGLQAGSAERAAEVAGLGGRLGLDPVLTRTVRVGAAGGPEAAARTARYAALRAAAQATAAGYVLLGHTLDDQAETVLLGLGRGSGPRSVAGMRPVDPPWLRPLLGVRRATTAAACAAEGLPVWADPHNADPRFTRARLRTEVLPLLEDVLQGGVAEALARTAEQIRADLDALDADADRLLAELSQPPGSAERRVRPTAPEPTAGADPTGTAGPVAATAPTGTAGLRQPWSSLDAVALAPYPPALRARVLRRWLRSAGIGAPTSAHLAALDAFLTGWRGQGPVALPAGFSVARRHGRLHLDRG